MKAVLCHALGEPDDLRVEEIEPSHLEHGQVRIGVHAAGVNFPDYLRSRGNIRSSHPYRSRRALKPPEKSSSARLMLWICAPDNGSSLSRGEVAHLHRN